MSSNILSFSTFRDVRAQAVRAGLSYLDAFAQVREAQTKGLSGQSVLNDVAAKARAARQALCAPKTDGAA